MRKEMDVQHIIRLMDSGYRTQREQNSAQSRILAQEEAKRRALAAAKVHLSPEVEPAFETPSDNNLRRHLVGAAAVQAETLVSTQ